MKTVQLLEQISQPLTLLPGVEPVTSLVITGLAGATLISYATTKILDREIKLWMFSPGGVALIASLLAADYWSYKGYTPTTYIGDVLISNADTMAFFLGLAVLLSAMDWDLPGKYETFKKVVGY